MGAARLRRRHGPAADQPLPECIRADAGGGHSAAGASRHGSRRSAAGLAIPGCQPQPQRARRHAARRAAGAGQGRTADAAGGGRIRAADRLRQCREPAPRARRVAAPRNGGPRGGWREPMAPRRAGADRERRARPAGGLAGLIVANWGIELLRQITPADVLVLGADARPAGSDACSSSPSSSRSSRVSSSASFPPGTWRARTSTPRSRTAAARPAGIRKRLRMALVVSEIALASLLLVGAGLTLRSFQTLLNADMGFKQEGLLTAFVSLPAARYREEAQRRRRVRGDRASARVAARRALGRRHEPSAAVGARIRAPASESRVANPRLIPRRAPIRAPSRSTISKRWGSGSSRGATSRLRTTASRRSSSLSTRRWQRGTGPDSPRSASG